MRIAEATFVVLDTETTGFEYSAGDRVVEIAAKNLRTGDTLSTLVNPGRAIPIATSAIHHIIDADVVGAPPLEEAYAMFEAFIPADAYIVAHHAAFDSSMLPTLGPWPWICSKRLSQHILTDVPEYKNQTLRYYFGGARLDLQGLAPHRALADVIVTSFVFEKLLERYLKVGGVDDVRALHALADSPIVYASLPFGKHRGVPIAQLDSGYLQWATKNLRDDRDILFTVERELARRRQRGAA